MSPNEIAGFGCLNFELGSHFEVQLVHMHKLFLVRSLQNTVPHHRYSQHHNRDHRVPMHSPQQWPQTWTIVVAVCNIICLLLFPAGACWVWPWGVWPWGVCWVWPWGHTWEPPICAWVAATLGLLPESRSTGMGNRHSVTFMYTPTHTSSFQHCYLMHAAMQAGETQDTPAKMREESWSSCML